MQSVLEQFAQHHRLGTVVKDDLTGQRSLILDGGLIVEAGSKLLLCPARYPEGWERCRRQMLQAGFEPRVLDGDSEEWRFDPADGGQVKTLFAVLDFLAAHDGPSQPEPRHCQEDALRQAEDEDDLESTVRFSPGALKLAIAVG